MSAWDDALRSLGKAQAKAVKAKLVENLSKFTYEVASVEKHKGDPDWTITFDAKGPESEVIRSLIIMGRTPIALDVDRSYSWDFLRIIPLWVEYMNSGKSFRFTLNIEKQKNLPKVEPG